MRVPNVQRIGLSDDCTAAPDGRLRARRMSGAALLSLASIGVLLLAACDRDAGSIPSDPLCGRVSGVRVPDDARLARVPGQGRLFEPSRSRHHVIAGRGRDAVTGLRVLPDGPEGPESEDTIAVDANPDTATDTTPDATPASRRHAWESEAVRIPEAGVLIANQGVLPAARTAGPIAWRVLACENDECTCLYAEVIDAADERLDAWQEQRLSLADLAGRDVVLRFETEALGTGGIDAGLWAAPVIHRLAPEGTARRPNLLLISLDTLAADHLGLHGYPRDTSPFIDGVLAPRATVFMQAHAPATTTAPSHMTLFTSLPPSVHGAVSNIGGRALPESIPTLASTLRDAGHVTGAVTENGAITTVLGFGRGFDHYRENTSVERIRPEGFIDQTFDAGRDFVEQNRGLPWFLFLHTYQVHHPYAPPAAYAALFEADGLETSDTEAVFSGGRLGHHPVLYDREIRFTDDRLRALLSQLEEDGLLDDTLVVVLADHGEAFLEHTYIGHGADLHRETVHVPLIFAGPGVPEGLRIEQSVGLADVMPTLLELLRVPAPPGLLGRSLVPLFEATDRAEADAGRPIFSEAWQTKGVTRSGSVQIDQPTLAVRRGDFKLIRYRDGAEQRHALYDLAQDPFEQTDLLADPSPPPESVAEQLARLAALLDAYQSENERRASELGVVTRATPEGDAEAEAEVDPDRIEKLRALGYIE